jgi:hypothetical protein
MPLKPVNPQLGQVVHFVAGAKAPQYRGRHLAALIVQVGPGPGVHLYVFLPEGGGIFFATAVLHSAEAKQDTWHYPEG